MTLCPNCGYRHADREYAPELVNLPLPKKQSDIILRLAQAQGGLVTKGMLIEFIYDDYDKGEPEDAGNCVQAHVSKVRRTISSYGWTIKGERFRGYRLVRMAA